MVRKSSKLASRRKPQDFLSTVMAFSHLCFCSTPASDTRFFSHYKVSKRWVVSAIRLGFVLPGMKRQVNIFQNVTIFGVTIVL